MFKEPIGNITKILVIIACMAICFKSTFVFIGSFVQLFMQKYVSSRISMRARIVLCRTWRTSYKDVALCSEGDGEQAKQKRDMARSTFQQDRIDSYVETPRRKGNMKARRLA